MKPLMRWALFLAVPLLLLVAVSATATSNQTRKVKHASGPITALAMDGPRVVYSTDGNGVYVWNVRSGVTSRVRIPSPSNHPLIQQVAIAGQRVAWITTVVAGNSEETFEDLYTTSVSGIRAKKVAHAFRVHEFGQDEIQRWNGNWIGGLVGSGKLLAVSRWTTKPNPGGPTFETILAGSLNLITAAGGLHQVASGEPAIVSRAADAGHVAVLRPDGSVGIYSAAGALIRRITPSSAQEIALGGGRLVVLTKTKTLEVYDSQTGALARSWPIKTRRASSRVGHLQAYGRIALFSVDPRYSSRNLSIIDLKSGKSMTLPARPRSAWNDATVGPLGLVYAVNSYKAYGGHHPSGTLVLLPMARVLADISRASSSSVLRSAASTPRERTRRTASPIENFAMDGPRVAYSGNLPGLSISTWNVQTGRKTRMSGLRTRDSVAMTGLAIAGSRVAWIASSAGNSEHNDTLFTSSVSAPKEQVRAEAARYVTYDPPRTPWLEGAWIHGLVGSGDVLAISRWSTGASGVTLPNGGLDLIAGGGLRPIVAGTDGIVAQSADSGRIAVLHPSGTIEEPAFYKPSEVVVYTVGGKLLKTIRPLGITSVKPGKMPEVVLSGDYLAVLTVQPRLNLYNWRKGKLLHSWRLPSGAGDLDIYGQLASYLVTRSNTGLTVHVRHLRTGRDVIYRDHLSDPPPTTGFVGVGIEKPGLAYAWNGCSGEDCYGVLRFVPMARVLAAVSKGHVR